VDECDEVSMIYSTSMLYQEKRVLTYEVCVECCEVPPVAVRLYRFCMCLWMYVCRFSNAKTLHRLLSWWIPLAISRGGEGTFCFQNRSTQRNK
jgi:hypothetical protein